MFLPYFLVFTLIFTLFENISLAGISLLFVFVSLLAHQWIIKKEIFIKKTISLVVLAFVLAMGAFVVKERRYYNYLTPNPSPILREGQKSPRYIFQTTIIGTGTISDISHQGKYVFSYGGDDYLLYSKKEYSIGDQLWIVGRIQENTHKDGFSYRKISTGTFALPIFSGAFDFAKWMKMKGRKGSIYEDNSLLLNVEGWGVESGETNIGTRNNNEEEGSSSDSYLPLFHLGWIKQMKKSTQEKVIESYGKNRISGLILGMLIGDKSQIPESEYQSFINSGLVHLVAVSGGNVLMIIVFLQCILFFLPFYIRLGLILVTITGYSLICGLDSSVFRAVLMGGINMVALFRGREVNIWRLLSISCIVMLIINPYFLAYDTGFLLSYSALIGIVYFDKCGEVEGGEVEGGEMEKLSVEKKRLHSAYLHVSIVMQYIYKSYIKPSIGASIGIFPIIIFFMGKINVLGVVGNLFVLPLVPFVMIYGFISVWFYSFFRREWTLWIEEICVQYIYKISDLLSQYGIYFSVSGLRFKYVVLLVCIVIFLVWRFQKRGGFGIERGEKKSVIN